MTRKQTWQQWARVTARDPGSPSDLAPASLAALTGQDVRALNAIVACWELYACSDDAGQTAALEAVRALLPAMQDQTRWVARELIPYALDWHDRDRLWAKVASGPAKHGGEQSEDAQAERDPTGRFRDGDAEDNHGNGEQDDR